MISILQQARVEGYREGWAQAAQCDYDEAYWRGQSAAHRQAPSRLRWFTFGFMAGALLVWGLL